MATCDLRSYLSAEDFEHLVQAIAIHVLGAGVRIFGDGPDAGREATFEGEVPYPSDTDRWRGYTVVQAKFRKSRHSTQDDAKWALKQLRSEIRSFELSTKRRRPDYYIFATNVVLTPAFGGSKDEALEIMKKELRVRDGSVWDADQICGYLDAFPALRDMYFVTPPQVLAKLHATVGTGAPVRTDRRPADIQSVAATFVGRAEEIRQAVETLKEERPLLLYGMPGSGKTELAFRIANEVAGLFPGGQILIDMRGTLPSPATAEEALVAAIQSLQNEPFDRPREATVADYKKIYLERLAGRRVLVMLDNAADATAVLPLVPVPGSALLVTSQQTLPLPEFTRIHVGLLPPDAAREAMLKFVPALPRALADEIASLCGYLPIALKATAGRLAASPDLDVEAYVRELSDEKTRLNVVGRPDADVRASFVLAYCGLPPVAARLFQRLAVFPATFGAYSVKALFDEESAALLSDLVRRNLVMYDAATRRYRLHDLLRAFARERLDAAGDTAAVQLAHVRHFTEVARQLDAVFYDENNRKAMLVFDLEWHNLATAHANVSAMAGDEPAELCLQLTNFCGRLMELRQPPSTAVAWGRRAIEAARQRGNSDFEHGLRMNLVYSLMLAGDLEAAKMEAEIVRSTPGVTVQTLVRTLNNLGMVHADAGEVTEAAACYNEALERARQEHLVDEQLNILGNLAGEYLQRGDLRKGIATYESVAAAAAANIDAARPSPVWVRMMWRALAGMSDGYFDLKEYDRALQLLRAAYLRARDVGDRGGQAEALSRISRVFFRSERFEEARDFALGARQIATESGSIRAEIDASCALSRAMTELGEEEAATRIARGALADAEEKRYLLLQAEALMALGAGAMKGRRFAEALELGAKAVKTIESVYPATTRRIMGELRKWRFRRLWPF